MVSVDWLRGGRILRSAPWPSLLASLAAAALLICIAAVAHNTELTAPTTLLGLAACGDFAAARHDRPARAADLYDLLGAVQLALGGLGHGELRTVPSDEAPSRSS